MDDIINSNALAQLLTGDLMNLVQYGQLSAVPRLQWRGRRPTVNPPRMLLYIKNEPLDWYTTFCHKQ